MKTLQNEDKNAGSIVFDHILEQTKNEYELEDEKLLKKIQDESKKEIVNPDNLSSIQIVVNMGFPIELVMRAYQDVGDDCATMLDYIYKILE